MSENILSMEQYKKKHSAITNADKVREVFGKKFYDSFFYTAVELNPNNITQTIIQTWLDWEYKEPEEDDR